MADEYHVVYIEGRKLYQERLDILVASGWKKGNRYHAIVNIKNQQGETAGTYYAWDTGDDTAWVSERAFPKGSWSFA